MESNNFKKLKATITLEFVILFPLFLSIILLIFNLIIFNNNNFKTLYLTAETAKFARLPSTETEQQIINFANNQLADLNIDPEDTTITIASTNGLTNPGSIISITTEVTLSNKIIFLPKKITHIFSSFKEGSNQCLNKKGGWVYSQL